MLVVFLVALTGLVERLSNCNHLRRQLGYISSWSVTEVWDFGTSEQYPALKYSDGTVMPNQGRVQPEDVPQIPQVEIAGVPDGCHVNEGESLSRLRHMPTDSASIIPLSYQLVARHRAETLC